MAIRFSLTAVSPASIRSNWQPGLRQSASRNTIRQRFPRSRCAGATKSWRQPTVAPAPQRTVHHMRQPALAEWEAGLEIHPQMAAPRVTRFEGAHRVLRDRHRQLGRPARRAQPADRHHSGQGHALPGDALAEPSVLPSGTPFETHLVRVLAGQEGRAGAAEEADRSGAQRRSSKVAKNGTARNGSAGSFASAGSGARSISAARPEPAITDSGLWPRRASGTSSRVISRSATFVLLLGTDSSGDYGPCSRSPTREYSFTSALSVRC